MKYCCSAFLSPAQEKKAVGCSIVRCLSLHIQSNGEEGAKEGEEGAKR